MILNSSCHSIVYISETVKYEVKIILYASLAVLIALLLVVIIILFMKGYFNWIIYYFKKEFSLLPFEVSWSLILHQKYPYKWDYSGTKKCGYYSLEFSKSSDEWNKVQNLLINSLGGERFGNNSIETILAIYNPTLLSSFISKWKGMATRFKMNSSLFKRDYKDKEGGNEDIQKWNLLREETHNYYLDNAMKLEFNRNASRNDPILVPVVHGTDYMKGRFVCMTGFASLSLIDAGYYGKGIYFTSSAFYTLPYIMKGRAEPSLIISWIIPGNIYPVIESPGIGINKSPSITGKSFLAMPLKSGFDSHYVKVTLDGYPTLMNNNDEVNCYDEFVIFQVKFNESEMHKLFSLYQREVDSLKVGSKSNSETNLNIINIDSSEENLSHMDRRDSYDRNDTFEKADLEKILLQERTEFKNILHNYQQKISILEDQLEMKSVTNDHLTIDYRFQEFQNETNEDSISLVNVVRESI